MSLSTVLYALYEVIYALITGSGEHGAAAEQNRCTRRCLQRKDSADSDTEDNALLTHAQRHRAKSSNQSDDEDHLEAGDRRESPSSSAQSVATNRNLPQLYQRAETTAFFIGSMGLFSLLTLWPFFFLLDRIGIEPFEWPSVDKAKLLALNAGLDAIYNLLLLLGIVISSPLWMSIGTMLVVPATILADWALNGTVLTGQVAAGIVLILFGFIVLQLPAGAAAKGLACIVHAKTSLRQINN